MKTIFVWVAALLLLGCESKISSDTTSKVSQPNIIYILADDLGYGGLGCYGQEKYPTPNIDKLAASGVRFIHHYAANTVCSPSRASLMGGFHAGRSPIRSNKEAKPEGQKPLPDSVFTIAEMCRTQGYVTGCFGKWGLGGPDSEGDPIKQGFDEFYGYKCQKIAHRYYPPHIWHNNEKIELPNKDGKTEVYAQDNIQQAALEFIEKNKNNAFFLYLPYLLPHAELLVPNDSIWEKFKGKYPETPYTQGNDYTDTNFHVGGYSNQPMPNAALAAMIYRLDQYVGQVMQKVKELGLEENTIIIFSSDNGPHKEGQVDNHFFNSSGGLRGEKRDFYEGGIRVPMIASWKNNIQPNTTTEHISAFYDVLPTIAEIIGYNKKLQTDGISFYPTLTGKPQQKQHEYLYWEIYDRNWAINQLFKKRAIRYKNWKAIEIVYPETNEVIHELYDLSVDAKEMNNLVTQKPLQFDTCMRLMLQSHQPTEEYYFN